MKIPHYIQDDLKQTEESIYDMGETPISMNDFPYLHLPKEQLHILKTANNDKKAMIEFIGPVPQNVVFLSQIGLLDPHDRQTDPYADDKKDKSYEISSMGKMYLLYRKNDLLKNYIPIIISILSLILSVTTTISYILLL